MTDRVLVVDAYDELLAAILRGVVDEWPPATDPQAFVRVAERHGAVPLLAFRVAAGGAWPDVLRLHLADAARAATATALAFDRELREVLAALDAAGVPALVIKGAAIAHTHYPRPCLRPRVDVDLLVRTGDRRGAGEVFASRGYAPGPQTSGKLVTHQLQYVKQDALGLRHLYDIHWKIANPHPFADLLTFDELAAEAARVPALGPAARGPSPVHALLAACLHRAAHHYDDSGRLIWLYDIHLLVEALAEPELRRFVRLAGERGVRAVCRDGIAGACARFATSMPPFLLDELDAAGEATAAYLAPNRRRADDLLADLRHLGWRDRLRLLREHVLPPADYMRRRGGSGRRPLPLLYAQRILQGLRKWF